MKLLILGGISEALTLARDLHRREVKLIYSIAGLVRQPQLECKVISGGFSQIGGLEAYLESEQITLVLDVTHPYASKMSAQAITTAARCEIPCWRYLRPGWEQQEGDNWQQFENWKQLNLALVDHEAVFFTTGRLHHSFVDDLYECTRGTAQKQWLRSATRPAFLLPPSMTWIEDIGPYDVEAERVLMNKYKIDALISKNSGGKHAIAKLQIARERQIPVYMLQRPQLAAANREFDDIDDCRDAIIEVCRQELADVG